ncbi:MAG: hypothetical protein JXQ96_12780 [Cyclobacteriaceae bacterium]
MGDLRYYVKVGFAHLFLCLFLFLNIGSNHASQANNEADIIDAYNEILSLKFNKGKEILDKIEPDEKSLGHYLYVQNLADILELLLYENVEKYKEYDDNEDDYLKELKSLSDSDPFKLFYEAEIKLQWALVKIQYGDDLKAGMALRSAWNTIQNNMEEFPEFSTNYKTHGLLHIVFGSIPDNYQWILRLLGIRGNIQHGMFELDLVSRSSPFWLETRIVSSLVNINILNKANTSHAFLRDLTYDYPENLLLKYLEGFTLKKAARSEEAQKVFSEISLLGGDYEPLALANYQLGDIYLQKHDFHQSRSYYSKFLNEYKGENFVKDAWFKTALTYYLQDNQKLADVHFEKAEDSGTTFTSADKNAQGILDEDDYPEKELMKVRLATDGGYYEQADRILSRLNEEMFPERLEKTIYYYRKARLKHKLKEYESAIYFYLFAIKKSGNENWYFAPSSSLNTGYIYRQRGDLEKAEFYFRQALAYKKHKYKSEIDVKARVALASIVNRSNKKKKK